MQIQFPVRLGDLSVRQALRGRRERPVVHAVEDVNFTIAAGETLGLVGESGSGKSTIGNALMRLVEATSGEITLDGIDVRAASGTELRRVRRTVAMVFQDPLTSLDPRRTIRRALLDPLEIHGLHPGDRDARVRELMGLVGLPEGLLDRYPHQLSGGQRQRVCIGRALAVEPKLIILDEATASLDVSVQAQILNLLKRLQGELGLSYLFIAHDLAAVEYMSHEVLVLYLGRAMERATRGELYADPAHPYSSALLSAIPEVDPEAERNRARTVLVGDVPSPVNPPSGCVFRTRCPIAIDDCAAAIPDPVELSATHRAACIRINRR
ncbi:oligopeptide ABC transporter ATP-binding protein [Enemella evansiae]|uniref:Oligopeptide ABC transporter ATP-binding protein n=1 Tax=Enemella evansiae TaxID=2016499 RepID=A0A255G4A9_9ACTN|nr:oligopeptide ABC transporter ATP-binding protein [Enemella evansiae]